MGLSWPQISFSATGDRGRPPVALPVCSAKPSYAFFVALLDTNYLRPDAKFRRAVERERKLSNQLRPSAAVFKGGT